MFEPWYSSLNRDDIVSLSPIDPESAAFIVTRAGLILTFDFENLHTFISSPALRSEDGSQTFSSAEGDVFISEEPDLYCFRHYDPIDSKNTYVQLIGDEEPGEIITDKKLLRYLDLANNSSLSVDERCKAIFILRQALVQHKIELVTKLLDLAKRANHKDKVSLRQVAKFIRYSPLPRLETFIAPDLRDQGKPEFVALCKHAFSKIKGISAFSPFEKLTFIQKYFDGYDPGFSIIVSEKAFFLFKRLGLDFISKIIPVSDQPRLQVSHFEDLAILQNEESTLLDRFVAVSNLLKDFPGLRVMDFLRNKFSELIVVHPILYARFLEGVAFFDDNSSSIIIAFCFACIGIPASVFLMSGVWLDAVIKEESLNWFNTLIPFVKKNTRGLLNSELSLQILEFSIAKSRTAFVARHVLHFLDPNDWSMAERQSLLGRLWDKESRPIFKWLYDSSPDGLYLSESDSVMLLNNLPWDDEEGLAPYLLKAIQPEYTPEVIDALGSFYFSYIPAIKSVGAVRFAGDLKPGLLKFLQENFGPGGHHFKALQLFIQKDNYAMTTKGEMLEKLQLLLWCGNQELFSLALQTHKRLGYQLASLGSYELRRLLRLSIDVLGVAKTEQYLLPSLESLSDVPVSLWPSSRIWMEALELFIHQDAGGLFEWAFPLEASFNSGEIHSLLALIKSEKKFDLMAKHLIKPFFQSRFFMRALEDYPRRLEVPSSDLIYPFSNSQQKALWLLLNCIAEHPEREKLIMEQIWSELAKSGVLSSELGAVIDVSHDYRKRACKQVLKVQKRIQSKDPRNRMQSDGLGVVQSICFLPSRGPENLFDVFRLLTYDQQNAESSILPNFDPTLLIFMLKILLIKVGRYQPLEAYSYPLQGKLEGVSESSGSVVESEVCFSPQRSWFFAAWNGGEKTVGDFKDLHAREKRAKEAQSFRWQKEARRQFRNTSGVYGKGR